MSLDNDLQTPPLPIQQLPIINGKGASSSTDPTYNVRMLMASENNALRELAIAEIRHVDEKQTLHVMYQEKLTVAEAKRIDAILAAQVSQQQADRERANAEALRIASQVTSQADQQRSLVATTAAAQAAASAQTTNQLNERLFNLEKAAYTGAGSSLVKDPIFAEVIKKLDVVVASQNQGTGKGIGANSLWGYIIGGIGALAIVLKMLNLY